jgi:hypothetical protein
MTTSNGITFCRTPVWADAGEAGIGDVWNNFHSFGAD